MLNSSSSEQPPFPSMVMREQPSISIFSSVPNLKMSARVLDSLRDFGYDITEITPEDLLTKKVLIRQYLVETDIHPFVTGITFDQVWENRISGTFGKEKVYYASLDDLIMMKEAAGRPKDLEDLKALKTLKEKRKA